MQPRIKENEVKVRRIYSISVKWAPDLEAVDLLNRFNFQLGAALFQVVFGNLTVSQLLHLLLFPLKVIKRRPLAIWQQKASYCK